MPTKAAQNLRVNDVFTSSDFNSAGKSLDYRVLGEPVTVPAKAVVRVRATQTGSSRDGEGHPVIELEMVLSYGEVVQTRF